MQLCMFHPHDHPMERGWVGRIDGDRVVHLAAQTLQSFFTGGGSAREHAAYAIDSVCLLAPVLHPPSVRVFDAQDSFAFANPAAIVGPGVGIGGQARGELLLLPRIAGVIGGGGAIGGFTAFGEWRDPHLPVPKDRDFALALGPVVLTPDAVDPDGLGATVRVDGRGALSGTFAGFDWTAARDVAEAGTVLRAGDLVAGPALGAVEVMLGSVVELAVDGIGVLRATLAGD